ncbi:MAG TPA: ChaN family lipoprotein [Taishania sp.]|nr:ChaN family lipoprotein [Taishania sp.]
MKNFLSIVLLVLVQQVFAQEKQAYVIFDAKGKKVSYQKLLKACLTSEITFFGEYHNNAITHWLQYELTNDLMQLTNKQLTLGFEMMEADQQVLLSDFLADKLEEKQFEDTMRMWVNYKTDYRPLVRLAKANGVFCVASNIPRRIASLTFKKGRAILDSLDVQDYQYMCDKDFPVDAELSQYKAMMQMTSDHVKGMNFINAQAIKDATMAKFIHTLWTPNTKFIHFNGAFHTDFDQGIIWYLKRLRPQVTYTTITTVEQADFKKLDPEHIDRAQFIICVNPNVTKTH